MSALSHYAEFEQALQGLKSRTVHTRHVSAERLAHLLHLVHREVAPDEAAVVHQDLRAKVLSLTDGSDVSSMRGALAAVQTLLPLLADDDQSLGYFASTLQNVFLRSDDLETMRFAAFVRARTSTTALPASRLPPARARRRCWASCAGWVGSWCSSRRACSCRRTAG